jgi:hypothetical protein
LTETSVSRGGRAVIDRPAAPEPHTPPAADGDEPPILIWEDESPGSPHWWLARAHHGPRQFYIAYDELTAHLVSVERLATGAGFAAIAVAAAGSGQGGDVAEALQAAKRATADAVAGASSGARATERAALRAWRLRRALALMRRQAPLAATAFLVGALLALAVALFAVSTDLVGWPMLAVGIAIGAGSGLVLRWLSMRRLAPDLGPWSRLALAMCAAGAGAAAAAGGFLALFWP